MTDILVSTISQEPVQADPAEAANGNSAKGHVPRFKSAVFHVHRDVGRLSCFNLGDC